MCDAQTLFMDTTERTNNLYKTRAGPRNLFYALIEEVISVSFTNLTRSLVTRNKKKEKEIRRLSVHKRMLGHLFVIPLVFSVFFCNNISLICSFSL